MRYHVRTQALIRQLTPPIDQLRNEIERRRRAADLDHSVQFSGLHKRQHDRNTPRRGPVLIDQRHGTSTLFAALNVLDGTVVGHCAPRHRHQEFLHFLTKLDGTIPRRRAVHLILDNYGTHTHPAVKEWSAARPRYHLHFTPTSASWLNLVERFFAEITERRIRRGTFRSLPELIRAITSYIRDRNKNPKRFVDSSTQRHHPQGAKSAPLFREFRSGTLDILRACSRLV